MSENDVKETVKIPENQCGSDSMWIFILLFALFGFGWNNPENTRIRELEKKVARLEGQMSMIGGKSL